MSTRSSKRMVLIAGAVIILSGFAYLIYGGIGSNIVYFVTTGELAAKGEKAYDQPVRLGGMVVPGTVKWNAEALDLRFVMTDGRTQTTVHSRKAPPQMFKEGQGVVVEGKLDRSGVFESDNLMVKHSNEYKAPAGDHGAKPEEMYKSLVKGSAGS